MTYEREDCGCIRRDGTIVVWCGTWQRDFERLLAEEAKRRALTPTT